VWRICVDGCSSLNVKAFTKILKKFVKVLSTTTTAYMCSFEMDGLYNQWDRIKLQLERAEQYRPSCIYII
jgi:hypothetical protein